MKMYNSVKENGIIEPLNVKWTDGRYDIYGGTIQSSMAEMVTCDICDSEFDSDDPDRGTVDNEAAYRKVAMIVVDANVPYDEDPAKWEDLLAKPELEQAKLALGSEKSLRKVVQFAPTVAETARTKAVQAILLALAAIVAYIWFRFGNMQFGLAAIVALIHDVSVPLGLMTLLDVLGVGDLRIDMPVIAAFLAIIGYSLNDTIVVFDRIRENRGKLTRLSAGMINQSINQTLARTLLTSTTTFLVVFIMLVRGGPGMYGFAFAMTIGVLSGTYSSLALAVPLVFRPKVLHMVVYVLIALALFGLVALVGAGHTLLLTIVGAIIAALLVFVVVVEIRTDPSQAERRVRSRAPRQDRCHSRPPVLDFGPWPWDFGL